MTARPYKGCSLLEVSPHIIPRRIVLNACQAFRYLSDSGETPDHCHKSMILNLRLCATRCSQGESNARVLAASPTITHTLSETADAVLSFADNSNTVGEIATRAIEGLHRTQAWRRGCAIHFLWLWVEVYHPLDPSVRVYAPWLPRFRQDSPPSGAVPNELGTPQPESGGPSATDKVVTEFVKPSRPGRQPQSFPSLCIFDAGLNHSHSSHYLPLCPTRPQVRGPLDHSSKISGLLM